MINCNITGSKEGKNAGTSSRKCSGNVSAAETGKTQEKAEKQGYRF